MDTVQLEMYFQLAVNWAILYAPRVLLAILIFYVGSRVIVKVNRIFEKSLNARKVDETIRPFFMSLVDVGQKLILFLIVANIFGFETTSFVVVISALAFAVGLALQGSLGHFASGILLLILKPYRVGEEIRVGDVEGFVEEIQIFNTIIRTRDNRRVIIPNGLITSGTIINISGQGELRVDATYSVAEGNNLEDVRALLRGVAEACPHRKAEKTIEIYLSGLSATEMKFVVRVWCQSHLYYDTLFFLNENVKKAFEKHGLEDTIQKIQIVNG